MARAGLNKHLVQKARDAILARGQHPSIDSIRIELGNTGSKTTIHRYLKELEEEEGARLDDVGLLSQTLQEMVGRLATRLHEEASGLAEQAATRYEARIRELETANEDLLRALTKSEADRQAANDQLVAEQGAHARTSTALEAERVQASGQQEQIKGLEALIKEGEIHRQSLEEKHGHAREALEHYRQSVKEQREQDQRRHETQVQQLQAELRQSQQILIVKQGEITQLHHDNGGLVAERHTLQREVQQHERQITALEQALKSTQESVSGLQVALEMQNRDLAAGREREQTLQARLEAEIHAHQATSAALANVTAAMP